LFIFSIFILLDFFFHHDSLTHNVRETEKWREKREAEGGDFNSWLLSSASDVSDGTVWAI